ncbi:hypothetical protein CIB95_02635 [Lottiidibacillus patelloidae]|uniref:UPF0298 protein CIB95_02635 n=1 Tax=Lottiidibacillus patelloidae TaxID=2670334 RepID=A0A263BXL9_9BACI|nr:DUF2129 domain-containing protein [Lottiidibacillus patelloidae]OZM58483.1 hypothetical protein CIB95_02635 [Lottiidibacillus patelloidae]
MIGDRIGIIVWLHSLKQVKQLRRFGNIHYVSKKMKYVVLYCDLANVDQVKAKIESIYSVKKVQKSLKPFINTEFQNAKPDKAKEYDYKMGL